MHTTTNISLFQPGLRVDWVCQDPDELSQQARFWGLEQLQLGRGRFSGSITGIHSERIQIGCTKRNLGVALLGAIPRGSIVLASIVEKTDRFFVRGHGVSENQLILLRPEQDVDCRALGSSDIMTVAIDAAFFINSLVSVTGAETIRGDAALIDLTGDASQMKLNRTLQTLMQEGFDNPGNMQTAQWATAWECRVLDACLADVAGPATMPSFSQRRLAAHRAEGFLMANPNRPVAIVELCQVAGVAKRTLMLGFRETFGMSPLHYHRRLRLSHARRELRSGNGFTIAQVALRWGFNHLGRFSAYYQRLFGERPSALRRVKDCV